MHNKIKNKVDVALSNKNPPFLSEIFIVKTAKTAIKIPTNPSPAINPDENKIPRSFASPTLFFVFEIFSKYSRIIPPIATTTVKKKNKNNPKAKDIDGNSKIAIRIIKTFIVGCKW